MEVQSEWGNAPNIYLFGLIGIFIIHSTTSQFWGFIMHFDQTAKILTIAYFLTSINAVILSSFGKDDSAGVLSPEPDRP